MVSTGKKTPAVAYYRMSPNKQETSSTATILYANTSTRRSAATTPRSDTSSRE